MSFVPADQTVRDRIRTEIDRSMCVEAGAGTGKTTVLVERIAETLRRGAADVDSIAVITFTEKAAAELSARVREELERTRAGASDPAEAGCLRDAIAGLYRARIETIHAFATSLLRERPVEARLDPQFAVLDDVGHDLAFDSVWSAWLDERLSARDPALGRALARGMPVEVIRQAAQVLDRHRAALPLAAEPDTGGSGRALREFVSYMAQAAAELESIAAQATNPDDKGLAQLPDVVVFSRALAEVGDPDEQARVVLYALPWPALNVGARGNFAEPGHCDRMKDHYRRIRDDGKALQNTLRAEALAGLLPGLQELVARFEDQRRDDGQADFDDLLLWARALLRDDRDVRAYFQRRYARIFVDEFQDTDPVQAEICAYLASEPGSDAADWRDLPVAPGKLFVVGDPKQSIYRFRQADIAIYDDIKARLLADGQLSIEQNFRSLPGVIDWANDLFDRVLVQAPGLQPGNVPLVARPGEPGVGRPSVSVLHGTLEGESPKADEVREEEGRLISAQLAAAHEEWLVRDPAADGGVRPAQWSDMVVLMPRRTGVEALEGALDDLGIPHRREGGRSFFAAPEVRELIAILRSIDDPTDALSMFAALRSSACACSDEEVFLWVAGGERLEYRFVPQEAGGPVAESLRMLGDLHRRRRGLSLAELVRRVLEATGLVEHWLARPARGPQAAANLLKVMDQARAFATGGGGALRPFAHWLATHRETAAEEAEAGISEESDDLVRILTIHAAKGLEFPIVALANLDGEANDTIGSVVRPTEGLLEFRVGVESKKTRFETPGFEAALEDEKDALAQERVRLLYVAVTRARDHLIVPAVKRFDGRSGLAAQLLGSIPEWGDGAVAGTEVDRCLVEDTPALLAAVEPVEAPVETSPSSAEVDAAIGEMEAWASHRDESLARASSGLVLTTASAVKPWDRTRPLVAAAESSDRVATDWAPPLEAGLALHRVMETVAMPGLDDLDEIVAAACAEAGIPDAVAAVRGMAQNALASDPVQRAVASGAWYREVPFTVPAGDSAGYAAGRMDLVFREDDAWVIVDYKTGAEDPDTAMDHHRAQAAVYAWALEQATGGEVREVVFVFPAAGTERAIPVDDHLREEGRLLAERGVALPPAAEPATVAKG